MTRFSKTTQNVDAMRIFGYPICLDKLKLYLRKRVESLKAFYKFPIIIISFGFPNLLKQADAMYGFLPLFLVSVRVVQKQDV